MSFEEIVELLRSKTTNLEQQIEEIEHRLEKIEESHFDINYQIYKLTSRECLQSMVELITELNHTFDLSNWIDPKYRKALKNICTTPTEYYTDVTPDNGPEVILYIQYIIFHRLVSCPYEIRSRIDYLTHSPGFFNYLIETIEPLISQQIDTNSTIYKSQDAWILI